MEAACSNCGMQHVLDDAQVGSHPRVQFRCARCGHANVVEVAPRPDQTMVISPLPAFARGGGMGPGLELGSEGQELKLPPGKEFSLAVVSGPAAGLMYTLKKPRVILGRGGADLEVNDPEVSRWHCALEVKGDVVRLRDLDSTNGTFLKDERVRAAELKDRSEFRIGSSVIRLAILLKPPR